MMKSMRSTRQHNVDANKHLLQEITLSRSATKPGCMSSDRQSSVSTAAEWQLYFLSCKANSWMSSRIYVGEKQLRCSNHWIHGRFWHVRTLCRMVILLLCKRFMKILESIGARNSFPPVALFFWPSIGTGWSLTPPDPHSAPHTFRRRRWKLPAGRCCQPKTHLTGQEPLSKENENSQSQGLYYK